MLTIHHLAHSQSERVIWLCEELGLEYELIRYERTPTFAAPDEYKALHPAGTAPIISDGPMTLAETGAVFDYILALYGEGRLTVEKDDPEFADYLFWYHFANGTLMPSLVTGLVVGSLGVGEGSPFSEAVIARAGNANVMLEARLAAAPYLGGEQFTAADTLNLFAFTTMMAFAPRDLAPFPCLRDYIARIRARPAYIRAMARAEPVSENNSE